MKALTIWQPWVWAIANAGKRVENRSWKPPAALLGQRIAIHAGKRPASEYDQHKAYRISGRAPTNLDEGWDPYLKAYEPKRVGQLVYGAVCSVATVVGYIHEDGWHVADASACRSYGYLGPADLERTLSSPWFIGPYGWILAGIVNLPTPVPCSGAQGLWALPAEVEAQVLSEERLGVFRLWDALHDFAEAAPGPKFAIFEFIPKVKP